MSELFYQLGIDWRLLASQAVNFAILLTVLRLFAYKPIMKLLKGRAEKIALGLAYTKEAEGKLREMNEMVKEKMKAVDAESLRLAKDAEARSKILEAKLLEEARAKERALMVEAEAMIETKAHEARAKVEREAALLVRSAVAKTVELDPKLIDERLVGQAVAAVRAK
ncbi:MAG: ATP synthase F0 subunit B [Patescibacteria group bacterium]